MENKERGQFKTSFGFIMAAAGSAVGLGNLWKFPYLCGQNGGGVFVVVYLLIVVVLGFTMMLGEMAIGRKTQLDPYSAYKSINKKWGFVGAMGILTAFMILSFYSVIGGWVIRYIVHSVMGTFAANTTEQFSNFSSAVGEPIFFHAIFMIATIAIVFGGISGGIEKASKMMMPALILLLVVTVARSVTLPGAAAGLEYYLKPDFSKFNYKVVVAAMGQVFFSLSLGMGAMITYGSYLDKNENLEKDALIVPALDTLIALLAGFAILPAVFAFGKQPDAGPSLLFITLPEVFQAMPLGRLFATVFFVLVLFAALTSSISLLEVVVSFFIDHRKWNRKMAVLTAGGLMFVVGIFASLSFGPMKDTLIPILNRNVFDSLDYLTANWMMPVGGFLMCIFIWKIWGIDNACAEIRIGDGASFRSEKLWRPLICVVTPIIVLIVLLSALGIIKS
ncbi:MAG: sodium-dependent transporter [Peptostreptococcaceae bacterium]|nr:sodium-dependent transporter [Peptostreptococcaceae bacterium]